MSHGSYEEVQELVADFEGRSRSNYDEAEADHDPVYIARREGEANAWHTAASLLRSALPDPVPKGPATTVEGGGE